MGGYLETVRALVRQSRNREWFICHIPFAGVAAGTRLNAITLRARASAVASDTTFSVVIIAGRACLMRGSLLVLTPSPIYLGVETGCWKSDSADLFDQLDTLCLSGRRLVAGCISPGRWRAAIRGLPSVGEVNRCKRQEAATAEEAIREAVRVFKQSEEARIERMFSAPARTSEVPVGGAAVAVVSGPATMQASGTVTTSLDSLTAALAELGLPVPRVLVPQSDRHKAALAELLDANLRVVDTLPDTPEVVVLRRVVERIERRTRFGELS